VSRSILLGIIVALTATSISAQSVIEERACPNRQANKEPDGYFGDSHKLTYESLVQDSNDRTSKRFIRCIENVSKITVWTEWKGLLSANDIPPGYRLYGSISITGRNNDPNFTDLWWGDRRDKKIRVQAKCYQGEQACRTTSSFLEDVVRSAVAQGRALPLLELLERNPSVVLSVYQDVYVRHPNPEDRSLVKVAIIAHSVLDRNSSSPTVNLSILGSANAQKQMDTLPELVLRFTTGVESLFGTKAMELAVPKGLLLQSASTGVSVPFANVKPPGDLRAMGIRTVFSDLFFRNSDKAASTVPLTVFATAP